MRLEQKACNDAKVTTSSAEGPKQIGVPALVRCDKAAIGQDNIRLEQVVDRKAVLARKVSGAPAEGEARDAGGRDDSKGHGQAECVGGVVNVARRAARIHPNPSSRRIYAHALHHRQVDHQTVVAAAESGAIVTTAPDSDEQTLVASEVHGSDNIRDVHAACDQKRPLVDHAIVQLAGLLVALVTTLDQITAQVRLELLYGFFA